MMITAMILSILFLVSYICHHLFTGNTKYGGEGIGKTIYYIILGNTYPLAGLFFLLFYLQLIVDLSVNGHNIENWQRSHGRFGCM